MDKIEYGNKDLEDINKRFAPAKRLNREVNMKNKYLLYCHTNKFNNKKYIGITSQNANKRWNKGLGYYKQPKFYNAIKKYGWNNFSHEIIIDNIETLEKANELEMHYIKMYNTFNNGYNNTLGGDGTNGHKCTDETKRKISLSNKGKQCWNKNKKYKTGYKHTKEELEKMSTSQIGKIVKEETKQKIREKALNRKMSDETKAKISQWSKNFVRTKEHCENISKALSKAVLQLDMNGNVLREFQSVSQAEKETNIKHISDVCIGKRKSAGNYLWKYKNKEVN